MVLDLTDPPIIINGAHTLVGCLTALAVVRQFNQKVILVSSHAEPTLVNEAILVDSECADQLCTLLGTKHLHKAVQCRNIDGYWVHDLERGDCLLEFDSHSLYKAIMHILTSKQYVNMVKIIFGIQEPSVHFQVIPQVSSSSNLKVPILKYVNTEGLVEEIISKFLLDCEKKSFVVGSILHQSTSGLNLKQSSSSYMYQQLDIPSTLYPFKDGKLQIRIQEENTTLMVVPKFLSDQFSTTFFFKTDAQLQYDQNVVAMKMLEFLKNEFPFTFSLITVDNIYSWLTSHLETIQEYRVSASATECIGFFNQSKIPHFGQYQFMEVFQFIKFLERSGLTTQQKTTEDIKNAVTNLELAQLNGVKGIERKLYDYRVMKNTMGRLGPVWNFLKIPVIALKQHLTDVFSSDTSRMTKSQKWRYRFIYGLSAVLICKSATNWYQDRRAANDIIQKLGTENELCKKLIRKCVSGSCDSKTVKLMLQSDEGLNFVEVETLLKLLTKESDRMEFLDHLIPSGNIKQLSAIQISSLLNCVRSLNDSDKLALLLKLRPYAQVEIHEVPLITAHFIFEAEKVKRLFWTDPSQATAAESGGSSGVLAVAVIAVFFMLGIF